VTPPGNGGHVGHGFACRCLAKLSSTACHPSGTSYKQHGQQPIELGRDPLAKGEVGAWASDLGVDPRRFRAGVPLRLWESVWGGGPGPAPSFHNRGGSSRPVQRAYQKTMANTRPRVAAKQEESPCWRSVKGANKRAQTWVGRRPPEIDRQGTLHSEFHRP